MKLISFFTAALVVSSCTIKPADPLPAPKSPSVLTFTATYSAATQNAQLAWTTSEATSISIEQVGTGAVTATELNGTVTVPVNTSTVFVMTARGEGGTDSKSAGVLVATQNQDVFFAATPNKIKFGQTVTLVWQAPNAQVVSLSEVGGANINIGSAKESGAIAVSPTKNTKYELVVDGRKFEASVSLVPSIENFALVGSAPGPGGMANLTYTTHGATSVTIKRLDVMMPLVQEFNNPKVDNGMLTDTVPATASADGVLSYQIEASDGTLKSQQQLDVRVAGGAKITKFTVPLYVRANAQAAVTWATTGAERLELYVDGQLRFLAPTQEVADVGSTAVRIGTASSAIKLVIFRGQSMVEQVKQIEVLASAPVITSFTVTPSTVPSGGTVAQVKWNIPGARRVRVTENDLQTVASADGIAAEMGTVNVYPNARTTVYRVEADNTIDPPVRGAAVATVTTPLTFSSADGGTVFSTQGAIDLIWPSNITSVRSFPVGMLPISSAVGLDAGASFVDSPLVAFDDIAETGTALTLSSTDEGTGKFSPEGFTFVLAGREVRSDIVTVSTNGALAFGNTCSSGITPSSTWPSASLEANVISPLWMDFSSVTRIFWQIKTVANEPVLIVQWDKIKRFSDATSDLTFQARIYQSGKIEFDYQTIVLASLTQNFISGVAGPRGVGVRSGVMPTSNLRRTFFGPQNQPMRINSILPTVARAMGVGTIGTSSITMDYTDVVRTDELGITEVMYNSSIPDAGEWFEVINRSPRPIELQGFNIEFANIPDAGIDGGLGTVRHSIANSLVIPPFGVKVLGQSSDMSQNGGVAVDYAYGTEFDMPEVASNVALSRGTTIRVVSPTWTASTLPDAGPGVSAMFDPNPVITSDAGSTVGRQVCASTAALNTQFGSPGVDKSCLGYRLLRIDNSFTDISLPANALALNGSLGTVDLSAAPISLWGNMVSTLTVSRNGWILPGAYAGADVVANKVRPSNTVPTDGMTKGLIAPFWDELDNSMVPNAGLFAKRFAAGEDVLNPTAHWVIQWNHLMHVAANDDLNFQAKLFDNGNVEFHYRSMFSGSSGNFGPGTSATIWLENPTSTAAITLLINTAALTPDVNIAYRFRKE